MQLQHLSLTHVRGFKRAEFDFHPGMNLIVGVNGVGKSTILDVIRILLAHCLPKLTAARTSKLAFETKDIKIGQEMLAAQLDFRIFETDFQYLLRQPREEYGVFGKGPKDTEKTAESSNSREQRLEKEIALLSRERRVEERRLLEEGYTYEKREQLIPEPKSLYKRFKASKEQPLAVYFSARRAQSDNSKGKPTNAFSDSLEHRELRLMEFASWWLAQKTLAEEIPSSAKHLNVLSEAVSSILDTCSNVRAEREVFEHQNSTGKTIDKEETTLVIDKDNTVLDIRQLSDGERGMLALVLDLARRLSQANPNLENPLAGKAVVLIDEIGLHLHPRWQRTIVRKLTDTFPNCQFIATTHSPLVIGEVDPKGLILLNNERGSIEVVQEGLQGFGLDASSILEQLMDTPARNPTSQTQIDKVEELLEDGELDEAREQLEKLRDIIRGNDSESIRLEASIDNLEAIADEVDTEEE